MVVWDFWTINSISTTYLRTHGSLSPLQSPHQTSQVPRAAKTLLKPIPLRPVRSTWVPHPKTSWWLNQPIWKICSPKLWVHLPEVEVKIKNVWNHLLENHIFSSGIQLTEIFQRPMPNGDGCPILAGCFAILKLPNLIKFEGGIQNMYQFTMCFFVVLMNHEFTGPLFRLVV